MLINNRSTNEAEINRGLVWGGRGHAYYTNSGLTNAAFLPIHTTRIPFITRNATNYRDAETRTHYADYFGLVWAPIVNEVYLSAEDMTMPIPRPASAAETATWPGLGDLLGLRPEYSKAQKRNKNKIWPNAICELESRKRRSPIPFSQ